MLLKLALKISTNFGWVQYKFNLVNLEKKSLILNSRQNIAIFITGIGIFTTIIFQVSLTFNKYDERRKANLSVESSAKAENDKVISVLKNPELYKVALLYTFSRLFLIICIVYIPIWLNEFMKTRPNQNIEIIALIPLIFFVSSFVAAFLLKFINKNTSHKVRTTALKDDLIIPYQLPRSFTVQVRWFPYQAVFG